MPLPNPTGELRTEMYLGSGRFQPHPIKSGAIGNGYVEVIDGLQEGDRVVTSANFLITGVVPGVTPFNTCLKLINTEASK